VRATVVLDAALLHSERWRYTHITDEPRVADLCHLLFAQFDVAVKLRHVTLESFDGITYVTAVAPLPADIDHNYARFVEFRELAADDTRSNVVRKTLERLAPRLRAFYEHDACPEQGWTVARESIATLLHQECFMPDKAERNQLIAEGIKYGFLIAAGSRANLALPPEVTKVWRQAHLAANAAATTSADEASKPQRKPTAKKAQQQPRSSDANAPQLVAKSKGKPTTAKTNASPPSKAQKPPIKSGSRDTQAYGAGLLADKVRSERAAQQAKWAGLNRAQAGAVLSAAQFSSKALRNEAFRAAVDPELGGALVERNGMLFERDDPLAQVPAAAEARAGATVVPEKDAEPPLPDIAPSALPTSVANSDEAGIAAAVAADADVDAADEDDGSRGAATNDDAQPIKRGRLAPTDTVDQAGPPTGRVAENVDLADTIAHAFDAFAARHDVGGRIQTSALFEQLLPSVLGSLASAQPQPPSALAQPAGHTIGVRARAVRIPAVGWSPGTRGAAGDDFDTVAPLPAAPPPPRDPASPIDRAADGPAAGMPARTLAEIRAKHGLVHRMDPQEEEPAAEPVDFDWG
jgi:hypothetical protein